MRKLNFAGMLMFAATLTLGVSSQAFAQKSDAEIQTEVSKALGNSRFSGVHADVHNGVVVLQGNVGLYSAKEDADKKVHHVHGVQAVQNEIEVGGQGVANVEDATLARKLSEKIAYDRVGYGTTAYNSIHIAVNNGVVQLSGTVYGPVDKDAAVSDVANFPGVRDVIDNIEVAPVSLMDDQTRVAVYRAVYGAPNLNRYAIDPAKPIRIVVINGNVTLEGAVNSAMDKQVAGIRANGVPGVFKVTNNLEVVK